MSSRGTSSRAAFARRFTDLIGRPPLGYLTRWRTTAAARLLRATESPPDAVATQVGHGSDYACAHAFRRGFGLPRGATDGRSGPPVRGPP
ncbi:helix-turn-helix domain-containing protein [Streptomyces sp. BE303]|uniref:helix-turn-helix domain-containing protein n=1 Tax=Streptomyces sp. BE303 TaxID=3002528 RepID=UPI002E76969F|nr:helix-turn-helix domain-containing protein [Streptomyces sp. BE303]MED7949070.1 helix-turn-helix domain-containing protein [Streptomyces sp. BE303]